MANETIEKILGILFVPFILIVGTYLISDIQSNEPPYPCELTIKDKRMITYNFIFFEAHDYCFEFEENPYFENAILPMWNESDYYEYEIGDNYSYHWVEEW